MQYINIIAIFTKSEIDEARKYVLVYYYHLYNKNFFKLCILWYIHMYHAMNAQQFIIICRYRR